MSQRVEIWIADSPCDLSEGTTVALTRQANSVGDLSTRNFDYTNQFTIPFTPTNDRIFENSRLTTSQSTFPYRIQRSKIVSNGIEIVSNGLAILKSADNGYKIYILSGAASFFDAINGRDITQIDLSSYNTTWDDTNIRSLMNETEGVVAPVMDYGKFAYPAGLNSDASIDTQTYLPSVYYKTIIDRIFSEAGYSKSGDVFSNTKYTNMIVAYSRDKFEYSKTFATDKGFAGAATGSQSIVNPASAVGIQFPTIIEGLDNNWDGTSKYQTDDASLSGLILFEVNLQVSLDLTVTGGTVTLRVNNSATGVTTIQSGIGSGTYTYRNDFSCYDGGELEVQVINASGTPTVTVTRGELTIDPYLIVNRTANHGVYFQYLLPDISQTDFIKDFMMMFGLIFYEEGGTIYAKSINEIIANSNNALDWTQKRVGEAGIDFNLNEYGQTNYFNYDTDDEIVASDYARGSFTVDNQQLVTSKDIYTSLSSATATRLNAGSKLLMATLQAYEPSQRGSYIISLTGTSGTANIVVNGTNYLATFNSTLIQTAADFVTSHAASILSAKGVTVTNYNSPSDQLEFTHPTDVIQINASNLTGDLSATPLESISQRQIADTSEIENDPGVRYLLVRNKYSYEPNVSSESNTAVTSYKVAYFFDPQQSQSMFWDDALANISSFVSALQKAKLVTRKYYLTERDVLEVDFMAPIFDMDGYYLIDTIKNFIPGRPTEVSMLKV